MPTYLFSDPNTDIASLLIFALSMAGSPGPNNVMLTASGTNFGFTRTIPHMAGVLAGMIIMLLSVAAGLGVLFEVWPFLHDILRITGSMFLLYMAWRIANAAPPQDGPSTARPMNSVEALFFQFVNPKAWLIAISAISTFTVSGPQFWTSTLLICAAFMVVMVQTLPLWTSCGVLIRRWLSSPSALRGFNRVMGILTAASVAMIWH